MQRSLLSGFLLLMFTTPGLAWESSKLGPLPFGPEAKSGFEIESTPPKTTKGQRLFALANVTGPNGLLQRRTTDYPYQTGARIGDGWDFLSNTRNYSQCV